MSSLEPTSPPPPPKPARSAAQQEAARRNGARSRGPTSDAGKARSAGNALKHGLTARVLLPEEAAGEFAALRDAIAQSLPGDTAWAPRLQDHLAAVAWRRDRAVGLETDAVAILVEAPIDDAPETLAAERRLALMIRYQAHLGRELQRGLQLLQPPAPTTRPRPASGSFRGAPSAAEDVADGASPADGSGSFCRHVRTGPIAMPAGEGLGTDFLKDCLGDGFDDFIAREQATRAELVGLGLLAPEPAAWAADPGLPAAAPAFTSPTGLDPAAGEPAAVAPPAAASRPSITMAAASAAPEPVPDQPAMAASVPTAGEPADAALPTEETSEQAMARLLRDPRPRRPGDAALADAIYFAATLGDPWYQGPFELWRLREALLPLHPHPDAVTALGSTAFATAAAALEGT